MGNKLNKGFNKKIDNINHVVFTYELTDYIFTDIDINGEAFKNISIPEVFIQNQPGHPNLPIVNKNIAIPQGSMAKVKILSSHSSILKNMNIAPAPEFIIGVTGGTDELIYTKDSSIYSSSSLYPKKAVSISKNQKMRGLDYVTIAISPFQYNPVKKDLIIYDKLEIEVSFIGGNKKVGEDRLRSYWWDSNITDNGIFNSDIIPTTDYTIPYTESVGSMPPDGCEYLIICKDEFLTGATTIKDFRTKQGILTGIITLSELPSGNTVASIKNYITEAYNTWTIPPVAILLMGDCGPNSGSSIGIVSKWYPHPSGYPDFPSDNYYVAVHQNDPVPNALPNMVISRMPATGVTDLNVMISKFINYETSPPMNASFYNNPITALGWQTSRWFQLCSEIVGGYFRKKGKTPIKINTIYSLENTGFTWDVWSTAGNSSTIVNYFGPNGSNYIPATPAEMGGASYFGGGTAANVVSAINNGSFLLLHRDHGFTQGWGEPSFTTNNINSLRNTGTTLPFLFSINCQTGAFHIDNSFSDKFYKYTYGGQNSGALGAVSPTEVSYSFLNDVYTWGVFDNMFPDFMSGETSTFGSKFVLPAFANAAGKHFLATSSWDGYGGTYSDVTCRLFHALCDAFTNLYTEVPQNLTVDCSDTIKSTATSFSVTANSGALIAISKDNVLLGKGIGTGSPVSITIPAQSSGTILVTVTKQNYIRYSKSVTVTIGGVIADFGSDRTSLFASQSVNFTDLSNGFPTSWSWSFDGGTPSTSTLQNPIVQYNTVGTYNVSLTVSNTGGTSDTKTVNGYIIVASGLPVSNFTASSTSIIKGTSVYFTNTSTNAVSYSWSFTGGTPSTSTAQNPTITYNTAGVYDASLTSTNTFGSNTNTKASYITVTEKNSYCASNSTSLTNYISKFVIGNFTKTSTGSTYSDFTSSIINLVPGTTYKVGITSSAGSKRIYLRIWIDYNNDGVFDPVTDLALTINNAKTSATGNLIVPKTATGQTRMRVSMKIGSAPSPCEVFSQGEVEDYTVQF